MSIDSPPRPSAIQPSMKFSEYGKVDGLVKICRSARVNLQPFKKEKSAEKTTKFIRVLTRTFSSDSRFLEGIFKSNNIHLVKTAYSK